MSEESLKSLQAKLDEFYAWPSVYVFKFIVPAEKLEAVMEVFRGKPISLRESRGHRYVGVTSELNMETSAAVIEIYRKALKIEGVITL